MRANSKIVRVGLLGAGTVGSGIIKVLSRFPHVQIAKIAVKQLEKQRVLNPELSALLTTDVQAVVDHPDIDIVVEVMGGKEFAYQMIRRALDSGKQVVTANKVVIAAYGPELFQLAAERGVNLLFEAAVAGGIPIVMPLKTSLRGNRIGQIAGILNGTTNYILTRMEQAGLDFSSALQEAQEKGFAEADPAADIEGDDAACKIAILASIVYQCRLDQTGIHTEGISRIDASDIEMARTLGYVIRLIALAKSSQSGLIDIRVHPMLVPFTHPLSKIMEENNAIWVQGDAVGDVMFYGKGAGEMPTASAAAGDVLLIADALRQGQKALSGVDFSMASADGELMPIMDTVNAYYIKIETDDKPGVVGQLGKACGDHRVSLNAVIQKGTHPKEASATIVLLTHLVRESNLQAALEEIRSQPTTRQIKTVLRVFQP